MAEVKGKQPVPVRIPVTVRLNDQSPAVKMLQEKLLSLGLKPGTSDGIFGPRTYQAVVAYQVKNRLTPDGIVGRQTWSKLLGLVR
jgi:peptidoglycan hydrolase-like protein with peptidoglycan-binding domain